MPVHHGCDARNERYENNENKRQGACVQAFLLEDLFQINREWLQLLHRQLHHRA